MASGGAGLTSTGNAKSQEKATVQASENLMTSSVNQKQSVPSARTAAASALDAKNSGTGGGGDLVRRLAHRFLRSQSTVSNAAKPVNGSVPSSGPKQDIPVSDVTIPSANDVPSVKTSFPPPLPPKQPRQKPAPPPRTSSCLSRPPPTTPLRKVATVPLPASDLTSSPSPGAVGGGASKSVRFGQEVGTAQRDALAQATLGLELAASLALAFARDVRRERLACASDTAAPASTAATTTTTTTTTRSAFARLYPDRRSGQEITLAEFYQLLQYVSRDKNNVGAPAVSKDTTTSSSLSSALAQSSALGNAPAASTVPQGPSAHLPPGYLTAQAFRKRSRKLAGENSKPQRSQSEEGNYDNLISCHSITTTTTSNGASPQDTLYERKTRSLPRSQPSQGGEPLPGLVKEKTKNWNEVLALLMQVLSACDKYTTCSTAQSRKMDVQSVSDSEEAYHKRQEEETEHRRYRTVRSKSTVSSNLHHSYFSSLSHRLQLEQYIAQTLASLTSKPKESTPGYVECWGSPEHERPRRNSMRDPGSLKIGLERALLRLDQRRIERHPRTYQHHHWRITPAECNALFLCKMSDDDRLSLTTAVSDDDDGESEGGHQASPFRKSGAAASFNCTGAVRKAGFLSVKKWLLRKKHQVELARKRGWRGYWVCLKGTTLLFYPCDSREGRHVEAAPKHLIIVDGAIMQPIPEHPKRDFIFCLSTAFGDAYLFQAPCQAELDTWVNSIHSACAAAFARHRGKTGTLHLLQEEIFRLERSIESDNKLKHMAELQLSVVSEPESRRQIGAQIAAWEENLERLHCEQFRLRCYMASLQHGELPNPKSLLTHVSRSTKNTLNRLGVFTVSSFHAYICARSPSLLNNLLAGRGATRRRTVAPVLSRSNSLCSRKSHPVASTPGSSNPGESDRIFKVNLPDGQAATVTIRENMTVEEFLASACAKKNLNAAEHFVRVKKRRDMDNSNHFVPHRSDLIELYVPSHESVEICTKTIYQVELARNTLEQMWGFSVEAELVENSERQDELCVFVSRVEDRSIAMNHGIIKGDEIMVINGALVGDLDMMYIESVLQEEISLSLMMRSCRANPPEVSCLLQTTDDLIDSLVCPPPPSDSIITDDVLSNLIVPAPSWNKEIQSPPAVPGESFGSFPLEHTPVVQRQSSSDFLPKRISEISSTNRSSSSSDMRRSSPTGSVASSQSQAVTPSRQLSDGEKLKKCILELVETERTYVKHLNNLLENYLEPLKKETFLSSAEINALFGNIQEIVAFQRLFLRSLEDAMSLEPSFEHFDQPHQFKNVLFAIGDAFLYHAQNFKLYSSFCASHSKAQKVLLPNEGSQALQEFLQSRNPRQQHSSTLESYLIKPIQRILKYPLLLQQLCNLTEATSSEHGHLVEALKGMEKVAEHINEMQRIHEEYGAIFDHLCRQHQKSCKQPVDLNPGELLYYGGVEWLNISDFLGKVKKGLELHAMCFVFKTAVVFLCKERLRQKKKLMSVSTKSMAPEVEIIRYQVLIPVTEVQVRAAAAKDVESHYLWELIHLKNPLHRRSEKVYHLSNSTGDFRNAFLKTIRQIIRESVRNMSIPPTKPPVAQTSSSGIPRLLNPSASEDQGKKRSLQRHSAGNIDYDNLDICTAEPEPEETPALPPFRARSQTVGDGIEALTEKSSARKMSTNDASRDLDPGVKSESEEDPPPKPKPTLGRTPNHLSLSTTSTLSTGSTSSQARLIQASKTPQNFTPQPAKPLGSPIWKPRDGVGEAFTLPRLGRTASESHKPESSSTPNYGTLGFPVKK